MQRTEISGRGRVDFGLGSRRLMFGERDSRLDAGCWKFRLGCSDGFWCGVLECWSVGVLDAGGLCVSGFQIPDTRFLRGVLECWSVGVLERDGRDIA